MTEFHFLRPWWLFGLLLNLLVLLPYLRQSKGMDTNWQQVCDDHLLRQLITRLPARNNVFSLLALLVAISLASIALAGPTWSRLPQNLFRLQSPRVLVLDLSETMLQQDLKPDRLTRAKFKLRDLLGLLAQDQVGLVVYTAVPFVVTPLTQDAATVSSFIPELSNEIMPVMGNNTALALQKAAELIAQAGYQKGSIILLTASPANPEAVDQATQLARIGITTNVLDVKRASDDTSLNKLANAGNGQFVMLTNDNYDIQQLIAALPKSSAASAQQIKAVTDQWQDNGRYFVLLLLPLLLLAFRRGWLENICE